MNREQASQMLAEAIVHLKAINALLERLQAQPTAGVQPSVEPDNKEA